MKYVVGLTDDALRDIQDIDDYVSEHDSPEKADYVVQRLELAMASLDETPERGAIPPEARLLGEQGVREVFFKPYRIIYEVVGQKVTIFIVGDGRRDLQALFNRRLLAP